MTGSVSSFKLFNRTIDPRRLAVTAVVIGALIGSIISAFAGEYQRRLVFDTWQQVAPRELTTDNVVVVLVDDKSVLAGGQWPWPRFNTAQLIARITAAEPRAIGIDIYFPEPDPLRPEAFARNYLPDELGPAARSALLDLPDFDEDLASIIGESKSVIARATASDDGRLVDDPDAPPLSFDQVAGTPPPGTLRFENVITSILPIDTVAYARAFVDGPPDSDGVVRRVPLAVIAGGNVGNGFAVELARIWAGEVGLEWSGRTLKMGDREIEADRTSAMQFKMGSYDDGDVISAVDLFDSDFDPNLLRDKVVVLGVGATGTGDIVATPLGSEVLGPVVQAQAVDAIIAQDWLSRPAWAEILEVGLAFALVLMLLAAAYTFNNWFVIPALAIAVALPIGSFVAYDQANLLFDPSRPFVLALCAATALLFARYALTVVELVEKRIIAAEQEKENESARALQKTMVPSAERLAKLGRRTEIGATLEPAKSVGGDFYDAMEVGENRLAFLVGDVSGKGLSAALFMALSKSVSKNNLLRSRDDLEEAIRSVNDELMDEEDQEMDLTLLVGVIDCSTGAVQMVNAGHEDPLIVHKDGSVDLFEMRGGLRLRTLKGFPYEVEHLQLNQGDTLVIITDGATDASNAKDDRFGLDRVIKALKEQGDSPAQARTKGLVDQIRTFERGTEPADDLTILALKYTGDV